AHDAAKNPATAWRFIGGCPLYHRELGNRGESRPSYNFHALNHPSSRIPANEAHQKGLCHGTPHDGSAERPACVSFRTTADGLLGSRDRGAGWRGQASLIPLPIVHGAVRWREAHGE